jgi:hypothetical protein
VATVQSDPWAALRLERFELFERFERQPFR